MAKFFVGPSGYNYRHWRSLYYPSELSIRRWLQYASRQFNSIELNGTFYSLKSPAVFRRWIAETPEDFLFAVKGSRYITHMLKLNDVANALSNFYASGVLALGHKTGPFLWQFPGNLGYNFERMEKFLGLLPWDSIAAAKLAKKHDDRVKRPLLKPAAPVHYRHAFEVRHPSFFTQQFYDQLGRHSAALVIADTAGRFPYAEQLTTDFVYIRLHGSQALYASAYTDDELDAWAEKIKRWGCDTYVYFDNDALAEAPHNALELASRLGALPGPVTQRA
jgi:uncharacterized protein YecE (DUF72 family)